MTEKQILSEYQLLISELAKLLQYRQILLKAKEALSFYADLTYSHTMGLPPEVQWVAENAIKEIDAVL